jgi:hypothetical protein
MDQLRASMMEASVPYPRPCMRATATAPSPQNLLLIADDLADFLEDPRNHPARCGVHARTYGAMCTCGAARLAAAYRERRPEPVGPAAGPRNLVYEIGRLCATAD